MSQAYEHNTEAVPRLKLSHLRALEKRRSFLIAKEADPNVSDGAKGYVREERSALDTALMELRELYDARRAAKKTAV